MAGSSVTVAERRARLDPFRHLHSGVVSGDRVLPVHPALGGLLPDGLRRGTTVTCRGTAAMSAAFLLAAQASGAGSWLGIAGLASFGAESCREAGVALERVVVVRQRGTYDDDTWGQVLAALIDGFDLVLAGPEVRVRPGTARRLQTRVQTRGAVLVAVSGHGAGSFAGDVVVDTTATWQGLGGGHGHLRARRVEVAVSGRRVVRPRRDELWLPGPAGEIEAIAPPADGRVVPLERTG